MYVQVSVCGNQVVKKVELTNDAAIAVAKNNLGKPFSSGSLKGKEVYSYYLYIAK